MARKEYMLWEWETNVKKPLSVTPDRFPLPTSSALATSSKWCPCPEISPTEGAQGRRYPHV